MQKLRRTIDNDGSAWEYTTEEKVLEVKVTAKSTKIKPVDGFEYFVMDEPPAEIEIPAPPANPVIPPPVIKDGE